MDRARPGSPRRRKAGRREAAPLPPPLLALTPGEAGEGSFDELAARVRAAAAAGLQGLLVREPHLGDRAFLVLARLLGEALREAAGDDAWLGVHDRAHLLDAAGADGLHVGFRSLAPAAVPGAVLAGRALGLSTHAGDELAADSPVDYVFHGPLRPTPSKAGLVEPLGPAGLAAFAARSPRPVWAIGGIAPRDARDALAAGARGVAVRSGVLQAPDPGAAVASYLAALGSARAVRRGPGEERR